jgi:GTPase SAR1 family protein
VGDSTVGKTNLLSRYVDGKFLASSKYTILLYSHLSRFAGRQSVWILARRG